MYMGFNFINFFYNMNLEFYKFAQYSYFDEQIEDILRIHLLVIFPRYISKYDRLKNNANYKCTVILQKNKLMKLKQIFYF